jgi:hypothetical protein
MCPTVYYVSYVVKKTYDAENFKLHIDFLIFYFFISLYVIPRASSSI